MTKDEALKLELVIAELRQAHAGHTNEGPSTFSDAADLLEALAQQEAEAHLQAVSDFGQLQARPEHIERVLTMVAQPARPQNCGSGFCSCIECVMEQEPVAWRTCDGEDGYEYRSYDNNEHYANAFERRNPQLKGWVEPLYTTPPNREWVGLTEMDIRNIFPHASYPLFLKTVSAIEAKLKELNHEV